MGFFDMDKNSLPEQVQENKEKIKNLETDKATIEYVDAQDVATLQNAEDYADNKDADTLDAAKDYADQQKIPKAALPSKGAMIYGSGIYQPAALSIGNVGDVLRVGSDEIPKWQAPEKVKAADIDSESATAGQVLTADGAGTATWQTPAASGGPSLVWSGSLTLTATLQAIGTFTFTTGKMYFIKCNSGYYNITFIRGSYDTLTLIGRAEYSSNIEIYNLLISNDNKVNADTTAERIINTSNQVQSSTKFLTIEEIYEF